MDIMNEPHTSHIFIIDIIDKCVEHLTATLYWPSL